MPNERTITRRIVLPILGGILGACTAIFSGGEGMLRTGLLSMFTLGALAVLEQYQCRKSWRYLLTGLGVGLLTGLLLSGIDLLRLGERFNFEYSWKLPPLVTILACTGYGAALLWCFNFFRKQRAWLRWTLIILAFWLVNYLALSPLFMIDPNHAGHLLLLLSTAIFFTFPWMLIALLIEHAAACWKPNWRKICISYVICILLYLLGACFMVLPMGMIYTRLEMDWLRLKYHSNPKPQLNGYILYKNHYLDLPNGQVVQKEFEYDFDRPAEFRRKEIAELIGEPRLWRRIYSHAESPDGKYFMVVIGSRGEFGSSMLAVFPKDNPAGNGVYIEDPHFSNIKWVAELPKEN